MDKLSPEDQAIVREAGKPAVDAQVKAVLAGESEMIALIKEKGMEVFPLEDTKAFSSKLDAVYEDAADRIGADLVQQARDSA
jgi:TRAP-type C4-dicarboxylate transport system substrate-binding protein